MLDDLAGKRTGERIRILRERKGLTRPTLAGLVGKSASWLKGIETGRRLPPRLPTLVKLAEALGTGDVAVLAGTDMDLGDAASIPLASFSRIPLAAIPPIREAVRDPLLTVPETRVDVPTLAARVSQAWRLWHGSPRTGPMWDASSPPSSGTREPPPGRPKASIAGRPTPSWPTSTRWSSTNSSGRPNPN
jgi:transcriptional regulator with XRE-family HTH domain